MDHVNGWAIQGLPVLPALCLQQACSTRQGRAVLGACCMHMALVTLQIGDSQSCYVTCCEGIRTGGLFPLRPKLANVRLELIQPKCHSTATVSTLTEPFCLCVHSADWHTEVPACRQSLPVTSTRRHWGSTLSALACLATPHAASSTELQNTASPPLLPKSRRLPPVGTARQAWQGTGHAEGRHPMVAGLASTVCQL
jgi:hypothetical protein